MLFLTSMYTGHLPSATLLEACIKHYKGYALQVLPLVPPEDVFWSPYSGLDALCGNTLMISLDELVKDGLLEKSDLPKEIPVTSADFFKVRSKDLLPDTAITADAVNETGLRSSIASAVAAC